MSNSARRIRRRGRKFGCRLQARFVARNLELDRLEQERWFDSWSRLLEAESLREVMKWLQHPMQ